MLYELLKICWPSNTLDECSGRMNHIIQESVTAIMVAGCTVELCHW